MLIIVSPVLMFTYLYTYTYTLSLLQTSQLYHQFMSHLTGPSSHHLPYRELWQDMDDSLASAGSLVSDKWTPYSLLYWYYYQLRDFICSCASIHMSLDVYCQSVDIPKWSFTVNSYVGTGLLSRLMDTAKPNLDHTSKQVMLVVLFNTIVHIHVHMYMPWKPTSYRLTWHWWGPTKLPAICYSSLCVFPSTLCMSSGDGEAAFYHSYETGDNGWLVGHIKAHQKLFKLFKKYYVKHEVPMNCMYMYVGWNVPLSFTLHVLLCSSRLISAWLLSWVPCWYLHDHGVKSMKEDTL